MKQTNNAIKFLMAQYRAIFKNAYFKGIASAVLLTAGLAVAGNAQAAAANVTSAQLAGTEEITVDGTTNTKLGGTLDDLGTLWNAPVKVTGGDNNSTNALTQTNDVNISGSGSLTIETTNASDGVKITAADNKNLSISINALNVNKGALLIEGGATDAKNATFSANTISLGQANGSDGDAKVTLNKTGVSGTVTIGSATSSIRLAKTAEVVFAATAADDAVLEGSLQATGGKLNFSGAGTLKTYTDADGVNVDITVAGDSGERTVTVLPEETDGRLTVGITCKVSHNVFRAIVNGASGAWDMTVMMVDAFKQLFASGDFVNQVSGPVGIVSAVSETTTYGGVYYVYLVALISLNLAFINLLPFPALDGGRIIFVIIRLITGKAITDKMEGTVHMIGMMCLLGLFVFVTWNDITRLFQ